MAHVVTAPLVVVKDRTGAVHYHYQLAVLPSYVSKPDLARLVEDGMVEPVEPALAPEPVAPGEPVRRPRRQSEPVPSEPVPEVAPASVEPRPVKATDL